MINLAEHFATDFQEFKASTAERIDTMEHLIWENIMGQDTLKTENMKQQVKQQVELLQNKNNRLRLGSESLLKVIDQLSDQQINTCKINITTENFITVKETGKNKNNQIEPSAGLQNSTEEFI